MFEPVYTITPKLLSDIKRIGILISELNRKQFPRMVMVELEQAAREMSAYSSTSIEGNPLPLTEVKRIIKNHPQNLRDSEKEVLNYNKALEIFNEKIKNNSINFNLKLLLNVHKNILNGLSTPDNTGKLRNEPVFVNDPGTGKTVYLPPDHQDVPDLVNDLIRFCVKNREKLDPLIVAGIFHKQFVIIHPFIDGNGRTARMASKILLAGMGLDTFNLFSFENYYNRNVTRYFKNVGVYGNYYDIRDKIDFTPWLEYFTEGIIDELLRVSDILGRQTASPATTLQNHHIQIINYIKEHGFITDRLYSQLTDRAKPTRNHDFNKLIEQSIIERLGKGKATYYKLKDNS